MKQLIVLVSMIILGVILFGFIAGPDEGSTYSVVKGVWESEIGARTMNDPVIPVH